MTETNQLSEGELKINIYALKEILDKIELFPIKNVLFFDINSYYCYLDDCYNNVSISHIMTILEPYVPLSLCMDDVLCDILEVAAKSDNLTQINRLKKEFYKKSVFNFFEKLKTSVNDLEIDYIFNLCNNLRIMQG